MQSLSIGCDAHKHYSQLEVQDANGQVLTRARLEHHPGAVASEILSIVVGGILRPIALFGGYPSTTRLE